MSDAADRVRFKSALVEIQNVFSAGKSYNGAGYVNPLERATRRHAIDVILTALGWNLDDYGRDTLEEVQTKGETTLYLDYFCRNPNTNAPLMIIEAKAWAKPFVFPSASIVEGVGRSNKMDEAGALLGRAVDYVKRRGDAKSSPLTQEWTGWLSKLREYVRTVCDNGGHSVQRVVITSGQWLVIFCDPVATFLEDDSATKTLILCFYRQDLIERSDEIHKWLAWKALICNPPDRLRPAQLPSYASHRDIANVFRALWVVYRRDGAHFDPRPQLTLYPTLVIERHDGILITVIDENGRFVVPHDPKLLSQHIHDVTEASEALLRAVNGEMGGAITPAGTEEFPGFQASPVQPLVPEFQPRSAPTVVGLLKVWQKTGDEFLLVTGSHAHFLHSRPTVSDCRFHDWATCLTVGQAQGDHPIAVRSIRPKSFFRSAEAHHCAHRQVHDRREQRCQIDAFEECLCCRACTLQTFCWDPDEAGRLPCGQAVSAEENIEAGAISTGS